MKELRTVLASAEFMEFYTSLSPKIQEKYDYVIQMIKSTKVVNTRFVKKLEQTEFYELRVSVSTNEYRTVILTIDSRSFVESTQVLLLNSFLKKGTKQYKAEVEKARGILNKEEGK